MPDIQFNFRKGGGSEEEILFGQVEIKATLNHSRGTSLVLTKATAWDIVEGLALATNVQSSPDPIDGKVEWAYEVTAYDRKGGKWDWLVGVPNVAGTVQFVDLPRYFETEPPLFGQGPKGEPGEAATIKVGDVTGGATAGVTNSGTPKEAVLDFVLPEGPQGPPGMGVTILPDDKPVEDSRNTYPEGVSVFNVGTANGWPIGTATVITHRDSVGITQEVRNSAGTEFWVRGSSSSTWNPFKQVAYADLATTATNGLMSSADKSKLDNVGTLAYISKTATDAPSTYPEGTTTGLFGGSGSGWPNLGNGFAVVTTHKPRGYDSVIQYAGTYSTEASPATEPVVMFRSGSTGSGIWSEWQTIMTSETQPYVTPEQFGAKGDGVTDDSDALIAAIASAQGAKVVLGPKTYKINKTVTNSGNDVHLEGSPGTVIYSSSQTFNLLVFTSNATPVTRFLQNSQTLGGNRWLLNGVSGVNVGDLAYVKSTKSWYYDARPESTDARKSETHRVKSISGNSVIFEDVANDGYNVVDESVSVTFIKPIRVLLRNITLKATLPPVAESSVAIMGLRMYNVLDGHLENLSTESCAYTGLWVVESYNTKIYGGAYRNSNYWGTGYGIQFSGSARNLVSGSDFSGCRRGVDISGAQLISRDTIISNCRNLGGGIDSRGKYWGWGPDGIVGGINFGFGSHGASDHALYSNNVTANVHGAYSVRGRDEKIIGNRHYGRTRNGFISASFGAILTVMDNTVGSAYEGKDSTNYDSAGSMGSRRPDAFLVVGSKYDVSTVNTTIIKNNNAFVYETFIEFKENNLFKGITDISGNTVVFNTGGVVFRNSGATLTAGLFRWLVGPNYWTTTGGSTTNVSLTQNVNLSGAKTLELTTQGATT